MFEEAQLYSPVTTAADGTVTVQLVQGHPGLADPEYQRRRNEIAAAAVAWTPGTPVPVIDYTEVEHEVWRTVCRHLEPRHETYACKEFRAALQALDLPRDRVPQLHEVSAAARLHERCAARQLAEQSRIEHVARSGRERQQADEDIGAREKRVERRIAGITFHPLDPMLGAAPSRTCIAEQAQSFEHGRAEHAEPEHAHPARRGAANGQVAPADLLLLRRINEEVAVDRQHGVRHVFDHALDDTRFDHTNDRHVCSDARQVELIDAGSDREQYLEIRQRSGRVVRRLPGREIPDLLRVAYIGPDLERKVRRALGKEPRPHLAASGVRFVEKRHGDTPLRLDQQIAWLMMPY